MATVFWDRKQVLMVEFMQQGTTLTNVRSVLRNTKKLPRAIQNQRCWMLTSGVAPFRYKARPHTAARTAGTFKLGVVWPPSLQPWPHSERLPPVYLPEELIGITAL
jgi:hypothetical protein